MTSEELIEKEVNERYPDRPVVLGRGNTCLSCGEVQRDAFKAGVEWQKNHVWHKGNDPADEDKEIIFEWESFGEKYHDVGFYDKKAKAAHIIGGGRLVLSPEDRWAYIEDLTQL